MNSLDGTVTDNGSVPIYCYNKLYGAGLARYELEQEKG